MGLISPADLVLMRESGRIVRKVLDELTDLAGPGRTTGDLDQLARQIIAVEGGQPSFLGLRGYPAAVCCSVNDEVVHGIPGDRILESGDLLSIDVGVVKSGFHADAAETVILGDGSTTGDDASRRLVSDLIRVTYEARDKGVDAARSGNRLGDIGATIQETVESSGFSVVRDLVGHGIGRKLHEPPQVPNFGRRDEGMLLKDGIALAIEPMVNQGGFRVKFQPDGWTVVTQDGSLSAHAEHTIVVTDGAPIVLTA